jgi:hypothetical protein
MADADFVPAGATIFGVPPVDVTQLYVPTPAYVVRGLGQEERRRPSDGAIVPTIRVTFTVPGLAGVFSILIDNYAFVYADPLFYMRERSYVIHGLYALPDQLPPYEDFAPGDTGVPAALLDAAEDAAAAAASLVTP